ncbi:MAG TPA: ABC transporter permease [Terriglobales bacterium]|nr:ABC transporter permease [Terriglobales bacterium]
MIGQGTVEELQLAGAELAGMVGRPAQSYWSESVERLRANHIGMAAGYLILFLAVVAVMAPLASQFVTHYDPTKQDLYSQFLGPGRQHWLGADETGRDTFTRLVWGARVSLGVGFLTVGMQIVVGGGVGLLAGFFGGWIDNLLMRIVDMVLAIPAIFLFILMSILFTPNTLTLSMIIASVGWGGVARLVRGETLSVRGRDFMLATRSLGASNLRLMLRHLLPNVLPVMIVAASLGVGAIILAEAALDFLGFGIHPPTASWGNMLSNAQTYFAHSIWLVIFPGIMIFVTVLAANLFGNAVRDAFDPRLR